MDTFFENSNIGFLLVGIIIGYGVFYFGAIFRGFQKNQTSIPLSEFPRDLWHSLIVSDFEPIELRIRLACAMAHDINSTDEELNFIAYNLPEIIEDNDRIQQSIKKARNELKHRKSLATT